MDGVPAERLGGARRCDPRILVAGYRYDSAAVVGAEPLPGGGFPATFEVSGAPGTRLPHIWLRSRHGARISTPDLCGTAFTVLGADASWPGAAAKAASELGVPLRAYHLGYVGILQAAMGQSPASLASVRTVPSW